jgi:ppGpp synthetase/RelA/SpoT-type nucleotidyltranferase
MTDPASSPEAWGVVYDNVYPTYRAFIDKLDVLLGDLLHDEGASYEWTYTWLSSRDDLVRRLYRAQRGAEGIEDPFRDLSDFAGVTVVVCDVTRAQMVSELVEREFAVDHDSSLSHAEAAARNVALADPAVGEGTSRYEFGQYAVSITDARAALPEWKPYEGLRARVEVQTVLQYAWERLDRDLPYYEEASYPVEIRPMLANFRALVVAADSQFDQVWPALEEIESGYAEGLVVRGELDMALDGESLGAYLRASETVAALVATGVEVGLKPDEDDYRPTRTTREQSALWLAQRMGLRTIWELDDFLRGSEKRARKVLGDIAKISGDRGYAPWAIADSVVEWLLLVLRRADPDTVSSMGYYEELEDAVNTLIGNPVPSRETP